MMMKTTATATAKITTMMMTKTVMMMTIMIRTATETTMTSMATTTMTRMRMKMTTTTMSTENSRIIIPYFFLHHYEQIHCTKSELTEIEISWCEPITSHLYCQRGVTRRKTTTKKAKAKRTTTTPGMMRTLGMTPTRGGCWRGRGRAEMISIKVRIV
jgi:hypothetical protein